VHVLITGSEGLIGRHLATVLSENGVQVRRFDLKRSLDEDIRSSCAIETSLVGVDGVIHLAAITRVIWGENDPGRCRDTNVRALTTLIQKMSLMQKRPWLLFASSREVYGQAKRFPVREDDPLQPLNTYARTKVEGEMLVLAARASIPTNICRFSTVYGSATDHLDRLVPAFARSAARGGTLRIEGKDNFLDCTHVLDVSRGIMTVAEMSHKGEVLPPIHFVSGIATKLSDLAALAQRHSRFKLSILDSAPRNYDANQFLGDPERARRLLGWNASISIERGFGDLVRAFSEMADPGKSGAPSPASLDRN
jgi:nucleoside-diphosphate-sugar epimerase